MSLMGKPTLLVVFITLIVASASTCVSGQKSTKVYLQSDTGKYLARCHNCGWASYLDSAFVHAVDPWSPWVQWEIEIVGDKFAFKGDNGQYLARCHKCWEKGVYADAAFVHVGSLKDSPWALWIPQRLGNGKWAFKADNGKYLARCNSCISDGAYIDSAFVHSTDPWNPWSQWKMETL